MSVVGDSEQGQENASYVILETAEVAPEIAFFEVLAALDMTREQSTAEWAVWGQKEAMTSREKCVRVGDDSNAKFFTGGDH